MVFLLRLNENCFSQMDDVDLNHTYSPMEPVAGTLLRKTRFLRRWVKVNVELSESKFSIDGHSYDTTALRITNQGGGDDDNGVFCVNINKGPTFTLKAEDKPSLERWITAFVFLKTNNRSNSSNSEACVLQ